MKKRLKYFSLLLLSTLVAAGIYIFCIQSKNPSFIIVMPIYQIVSILGICGYLFLFFRHNNEIGKAKADGVEVDERAAEARREKMKLYIAIVFPFVAVTLCDYIYLLLLADNKIFSAVLKFFG